MEHRRARGRRRVGDCGPRRQRIFLRHRPDSLVSGSDTYDGRTRGLRRRRRSSHPRRRRHRQRSGVRRGRSGNTDRGRRTDCGPHRIIESASRGYLDRSRRLPGVRLARDSVQIDAIYNPTFVSQSQGPSPSLAGQYFTYGTDSAVSLSSTAGDVTLELNNINGTMATLVGAQTVADNSSAFMILPAICRRRRRRAI